MRSSGAFVIITGEAAACSRGLRASFFLLWIAIAGVVLTCKQTLPAGNRGPLTESTQSMPVLDPIESVDLPGGRILARLHRGLYRIENGQAKGELAAETVVSPDGRTIRIQLFPGILFSDGSPVDSTAVQSSLLASAGRTLPPGPRASLFDGISLIETSGPERLFIHLVRRDPRLPLFLTLPSAFIHKRTEKGIIGCGAYQLAGHPDGNGIDLSPNIFFRPLPGDKEELPLTDGIHVLIQPEEAANRFLLLKGDLDVYRSPPGQVRSLKDTGLVITTADELAVHYVAIHTAKPDLDTAFRRAANLAVPRRSLVTHLLADQARVSTGPVPPALRLDRKGTAGDTDSFNLEEARRLLKMSAWSQAPRPIEFLHKGDSDATLLARAIEASLTKAGIPVRRRPMDRNLLRRENALGHGDLFLLNWSADFPEAEDFLIPLFHSKNAGGSNRAHFRNSELDAILDRLAASDPDRLEWISRADALIRRESPWIFLYFPIENVALSPRVRRFPAAGFYSADRGLGILLR